MTTSIIIPVYNLARYLPETLESVRAQTNADWEAIVIDDCSTDDSRAVAQNYIARCNDPRIRVIWTEKNSGVSAARNLGVNQARGDWLAFLDGDDVYEPDFIASMLEAATSGAEVVHCSALKWDGHKVLGVYGPAKKEIRCFPGSLFARNYILPSTMMCSREAWLRNGPFDTQPSFQHVEDWDWVLRAAQAGLRFHYVDKPLSRWRQHPASATANRIPSVRRVLAICDRYDAYPGHTRYKRRARAEALRWLAYWQGSDNPMLARDYYSRYLRLRPWSLAAMARHLIADLYARGRQGWLPGFLRFPPPGPTSPAKSRGER